MECFTANQRTKLNYRLSFPESQDVSFTEFKVAVKKLLAFGWHPLQPSNRIRTFCFPCQKFHLIPALPGGLVLMSLRYHDTSQPSCFLSDELQDWQTAGWKEDKGSLTVSGQNPAKESSALGKNYSRKTVKCQLGLLKTLKHSQIYFISQHH